MKHLEAMCQYPLTHAIFLSALLSSWGPSPFLDYILYLLYKVRPLPPGFLADMVQHCQQETSEEEDVVEGVSEGGREGGREPGHLSVYAPSQVFHNILYGLREATTRSSLMDEKICEGYFFLAELCDMRPDGTNFRPICQMVGLSAVGMVPVHSNGTLGQECQPVCTRQRIVNAVLPLSSVVAGQ